MPRKLGLSAAQPPNPLAGRKTWLWLDHYWFPDRNNALRRIFLLIGLALLVDRFGNLHEFISMVTKVNTHVLYILTPPAMVGFLITGGLRRYFSHKISYMWAFFMAFMVLSIPFSFWLGGSVQNLIAYGKASVPIILVMGGMVVTWKECRSLMYAMAIAGFIVLIAARNLKSDDEGRFMLEGGSSIGNANDMAAHLMFMIPFLLFFVLNSKSPIWMRLLSFLASCYGFYVVFSSGSRGALLAMILVGIVALFKAPGKMRIPMLVAGAAMVMVLVTVAPADAITRMTSIFQSKGDFEHAEAAASKAIREEMLGRAVGYAVTHPLLGVGLGQFTSYDSEYSGEKKAKKYWLGAHNSYLEVAAEIGLIGLGLMIAALFMSFRLVSKTHALIRAMKGKEEMTLALFCSMLSLVGFCTTAMFLNFGFSHYFPCLGGLAMVLTSSIRNELAYEERLSNEVAGREAARISSAKSAPVKATVHYR